MFAYGNPNGANLGMIDKKDVAKQPVNCEAQLTSSDPMERRF